MVPCSRKTIYNTVLTSLVSNSHDCKPHEVRLTCSHLRWCLACNRHSSNIRVSKWTKEVSSERHTWQRTEATHPSQWSALVFTFPLGGSVLLGFCRACSTVTGWSFCAWESDLIKDGLWPCWEPHVQGEAQDPHTEQGPHLGCWPPDQSPCDQERKSITG